MAHLEPGFLTAYQHRGSIVLPLTFYTVFHLQQKKKKKKLSQISIAASAFFKASYKTVTQTPLNSEVNAWPAGSVMTHILLF